MCIRDRAATVAVAPERSFPMSCFFNCGTNSVVLCRLSFSCVAFRATHAALPPSASRTTTPTMAARQKLWRAAIVGVVVLLALGGSAAWVALKATQLKDNLQSTTELVPQLKKQLIGNDLSGATATVAA